jgi:hypothetical protein
MGIDQWKIRRWWCKTARARKQPHSLEHSYGETSNVPRSDEEESDEDYDEEYERIRRTMKTRMPVDAVDVVFRTIWPDLRPWQLDLWVYFDVVFAFGRPDKRTKVHLK